MNVKLLLPLVLSVLLSDASAQEVLLTPSWVVTIIGCGEGVVACDTVKYVGVSRKTGASLTLTGSTIHSRTANGAPGQFHGYQFKNGKFTYNVYQNGALQVTQGEKLIVDEKGTWDWELVKRK